MKATNIVRVYWKKLSNEIIIKARRYEGRIYEPTGASTGS